MPIRHMLIKTPAQQRELEDVRFKHDSQETCTVGATVLTRTTSGYVKIEFHKLVDHSIMTDKKRHIDTKQNKREAS